MLVKAWRTKDLRSYSLGQIVLYNIGNLLYWLYVISLPVGPIWLMHGFYTVAMGLMLIWYVLYVKNPAAQHRRIGRLKSIKAGIHAAFPDRRVFALHANTNVRPSASDIA